MQKNRTVSLIMLTLLILTIALYPVVPVRADNSRIRLISVSTAGDQGSYDTALGGSSKDGRYIVMSSRSSLDGPNYFPAVFVRDTVEGTTHRISRPYNGIDNRGGCHTPRISANGRFVTFACDTPEMLPGDTNGKMDVFVHDRDADQDGIMDEAGAVTTSLVSLKASGEQQTISNDPRSIDVSDDGRFVLFYGGKVDFVPEDRNGENDIFIRDRDTDEDGIFDEPGSSTTFAVAVNQYGKTGNGYTYMEAELSDDGRYVVFSSHASDLVAGDTNGQPDVFVRDLQTGKIIRVSVSSTGQQGNSYSVEPSISGDGRFVAFLSWSTNFVPDISIPSMTIFIHDRDTDEDGIFDEPGQTSTELPIPGWPIAGFYPDISDDGQMITFINPNGLIPGDLNGVMDAFVIDRQAGTRRMVSIPKNGGYGNGISNGSMISGNGRYAMFSSSSSNMVAGDQNGGMTDVFLVDLTQPDPPVAGEGQAPTDIKLTASAVAENQPPGTPVGLLSGVDSGGSLTFSLVSGAGGEDNALFSIQGNRLLTAAHFDYESRSALTIRVRATASGGASFEKAFAITVTDVDEPLVGFSPAESTAVEGQEVSVRVILDRPASGPVTVEYASQPDTALASEDFLATSGVLTFAPGEEEKALTLPVLDNLSQEDVEAFTVTLRNPSGAEIGQASHTITILDDDTAPVQNGGVIGSDDPEETIYSYLLNLGEFLMSVKGLMEDANLTVDTLPEMPPAPEDIEPVGAFDVEMVSGAGEPVHFTTALTCFPYQDSDWQSRGIPETHLRLYHFTGLVWKDVTHSFNLQKNLICGLTDSFSPFMIGIPEDAIHGGQIILAAGSLNLTPHLIEFGTVSLNGTVQEAAGLTDDWAVIDATGSG